MSNTVKKKFNIGRRVYFVDRTAKPYPVFREGSINDVWSMNSEFYYHIAISRSVNKRIVDYGGIAANVRECDISFSKAEVYEKIIESLKEQIGGLFNEILRVYSLLAEENESSKKEEN